MFFGVFLFSLLRSRIAESNQCVVRTVDGSSDGTQNKMWHQKTAGGFHVPQWKRKVYFYNKPLQQPEEKVQLCVANSQKVWANGKSLSLFVYNSLRLGADAQQHSAVFHVEGWRNEESSERKRRQRLDVFGLLLRVCKSEMFGLVEGLLVKTRVGVKNCRNVQIMDSH